MGDCRAHVFGYIFRLALISWYLLSFTGDGCMRKALSLYLVFPSFETQKLRFVD